MIGASITNTVIMRTLACLRVLLAGQRVRSTTIAMASVQQNTKIRALYEAG